MTTALKVHAATSRSGARSSAVEGLVCAPTERGHDGATCDGEPTDAVCQTPSAWPPLAVAFHRRDARELGTEEVRAWVMHLRRAGRAPRSINVAMSALRFLFGVTLR